MLYKKGIHSLFMQQKNMCFGGQKGQTKVYVENQGENVSY